MCAMVSDTIQRDAASARKRTWSAKLRTPFAVLALVADERGLAELHYRPRDEDEQAPTNAIAQQAVRELERYVADPQYRFTVPLAPRGSAFQRRVWDALRAIPVGESRTYGEIAHAVGSAPRPVGQACGANPIALIVPCHRVVGSRGALGGFMHRTSDDAVGVKRWLLEHEGCRFGLF
jgi:methylated-DNA-[protein]-cysteine S-methyltransferase